MGVCVGMTMMTEARDFKLWKEYRFFRHKTKHFRAGQTSGFLHSCQCSIWQHEFFQREEWNVI